MGPPDALVVVARLLRRGPPRDPVLGHPQVDPGTEGPALAPQDDGPHPLVEPDLVGPGPELAGGLPTPGVQLVGAVQAEDGDMSLHRQVEMPLVLGDDG
jgi:hypothetical protein